MSTDMVRHLSSFDLSESAVLALSVKSARQTMAQVRSAHGFKACSVPLLTEPTGNVKLQHSETDRVYAYGLSLSPSDMSGAWNLCRYATAGCRSACLATSGKGAFSATQRARVWKTALLGEHPAAFLRLLVEEIDAVGRKVPQKTADGWIVSLRLNVLSDLPWETIAPWIVARAVAAGIRVYDYTKWSNARRNTDSAAAAGYDLSSSVSERTTAVAIRTMRRPVIVFDTKRGHDLPTTFAGRIVVDGDRSDARFLDDPSAIVGLRFKRVTTSSLAGAIATGFVKVAS